MFPFLGNTQYYHVEMLWSYIMYSYIRIREFIVVASAVHGNLQC